jgi:hypothetical protein
VVEGEAVIPITSQAVAIPGTRIRLVPSHGARHVTHELPMPVAACPVSRNPLSGTVRVEYSRALGALEVVSLHDALAWACSGDPDAPRSVESLADWLARECRIAVGVPVTVTLDLVVNPGPQRLVVRCRR